jgi:hypothetical protein
MSALKVTHDPVRPSVHGANHQHEDHARHYAECMQCRRDREHTQADLHFHHDDTGARPTQLKVRVSIIPGSSGEPTHVTVVGSILSNRTKDGVLDVLDARW